MGRLSERLRLERVSKMRKKHLLPRKLARGLRVARVSTHVLLGGARMIGRGAWRGGKLSATTRARVAAMASRRAARRAGARRGQMQARRESRLRSRATASASAVVGAVGMYFFDPRAGRRRRHLVRDKARKAVRRRLRETWREMRYSRGVVTGRLHKATARSGRQSEAEPDDVTLARKVESEVFRDHSIPKGKINVNSEDSVIYLRGELKSADEIERVVKRASGVSGVREVRSLLHTPGSAPPEHESAGSTLEHESAGSIPASDGATGLK